jgi:hypothetical protein
MRTIELSDDEHTLLGDLLDQSYRELKEEIYKTETRQYKEALKLRESHLVSMLTKLGRPAATQAA